MEKKVLVLSYVGNDSFNRPVYRSGDTLFVDVEPRKDKKARLCTKLYNCLECEPDTPIEYLKEYEGVTIEFFPKRITW